MGLGLRATISLVFLSFPGGLVRPGGLLELPAESGNLWVSAGGLEVGKRVELMGTCVGNVLCFEARQEAMTSVLRLDTKPSCCTRFAVLGTGMGHTQHQSTGKGQG